MDETSTYLADNVRHLRETRGLSQQQCANISSVPRPTWASLESGAANPTLAVLLKVAAALQVSIEELIRPRRASCQLFPAGSLPQRKKARCIVRQLLPESIVGTAIERMELPGGASMVGVPHTAGTREYLICERGRLQLAVEGETWELSPGDVVAFRGDQKHSYRSLSNGRDNRLQRDCVGSRLSLWHERTDAGTISIESRKCQTVGLIQACGFQLARPPSSEDHDDTSQVVAPRRLFRPRLRSERNHPARCVPIRRHLAAKPPFEWKRESKRPGRPHKRGFLTAASAGSVRFEVRWRESPGFGESDSWGRGWCAFPYGYRCWFVNRPNTADLRAIGTDRADCVRKSLP